MKTVLFSGVEHRVRRRETIEHSPQGITFKTMQQLHTMKKDHELSNVKGEAGVVANLGAFRRIYTTNNYIPKQYLNGVDLIYSPGYLLFNDFPFVIEIDNVSVLAYYKLPFMRLCKPLIKRKLRSENCKAIICISEAAKQSVVRYFKDATIENKCVVIYPYAEPQKILRKASRTARFLFVSSNFYLKGGKQVVHAFLELQKKQPNIHLTVVTKLHEVDPKLLTIMKESKNITVQEANLDKKTLFERYYSNADVFVLPTYQDSFGLVYLEALSAGLPIIATDMFAVPEMVQHKRNGFILRSPIAYFKDFLPNPKWWEKNKALYAKKHDFPEHEKELLQYMELLAKDASLRKRMGEASLRIFKERFSEKARLTKLGAVLEAAGVEHVRH